MASQAFGAIATSPFSALRTSPAMPDAEDIGVFGRNTLALQDGHRLPSLNLPSRATWFLCFDMLVVATFLLGWCMTVINIPEVIDDNPLIRVAGYNPVTVGINHYPARVVANVLWGVMLFPLTMFSIAKFYHLTHCGLNDGTKFLMRVMMVTSYCLIMGFGCSLGFIPKFMDPTGVIVHLAGFCFFLFGLAICRGVEILCFLWDPVHRTGEGGTWPEKGNRYVASQCTYVLLCFVGGLCPGKMMLATDMEERLANAEYAAEQRFWDWDSLLNIIWSVLFICIPFVVWHSSPHNTTSSFVVFAKGNVAQFIKEHTVIEHHCGATSRGRDVLVRPSSSFEVADQTPR